MKIVEKDVSSAGFWWDNCSQYISDSVFIEPIKHPKTSQHVFHLPKFCRNTFDIQHRKVTQNVSTCSGETLCSRVFMPMGMFHPWRLGVIFTIHFDVAQLDLIIHWKDFIFLLFMCLSAEKRFKISMYFRKSKVRGKKTGIKMIKIDQRSNPKCLSQKFNKSNKFNTSIFLYHKKTYEKTKNQQKKKKRLCPPELSVVCLKLPSVQLIWGTGN